MKKVSIVIPLYNASKYIEECLDSCLSQEYANCEIIVVNDGSTDDSAKKIKPYLGKIKYIYQENMGGSAARNSGLDNANGEYIYFLDADDAIFPDTVSKMVAAIESCNSDLCIGAYESMNADGMRGGIFQFMDEDYVFRKEEIPVLFSIYPNPSTKLYKMDIIRNNKLYFEDVRIAQDLNFFFRYLINCRKVSYISDILYKYRITAGSISTSYDERILDITKAFAGVEMYARLNSFPLYDIQNLKFAHIFSQMVKVRHISSAKVRRRIFYKLAKELSKTQVSKGALTYGYVRNSVLKAKILLAFSKVYTSQFAYWFDSRLSAIKKKCLK